MSFLKKYLDRTPKESVNSPTVAYLAALDQIESVSPTVAEAILKEIEDERSHLKMIASENFSSFPVQLAMGSLLTDKYAEGIPQHRYYAGCKNIDTIEEEATSNLKKLFGAEHAYVQPHSGSDANLIAYWSILVHRVENPEIKKLGKKSLSELSEEEYERVRQLILNQKILGMSLNAGGHLSHGFRQNISSKMMHAYSYEVDPKSHLLDYEALRKQAHEVKPSILLAGYSAYPRNLDFSIFREIADEVGATFMVDMAHFAGLVAGKVLKGKYNPVPYADIITSTTHKTLRGPRGGFILCKSELAPIVNTGCPLVMGGPLPHIMAAKALAFKEALSVDFQNYASKVVENAAALAEGLLKRGLDVMTNGTENHLLIFGVSKFGLTGRQGEQVLREAGITTNRNTLPFDKEGPWYTSGVRVGTPALTTLGMGVKEMDEIASIIYDVVSSTRPKMDPKTGERSRALYEIDAREVERNNLRVKKLLTQFPLYPELDLSDAKNNTYLGASHAK